MEKLCFTKQNNTFEWKSLVLLSKTKLFRETLENLQKTQKTKKTNKTKVSEVLGPNPMIFVKYQSDTSYVSYVS